MARVVCASIAAVTTILVAGCAAPAAPPSSAPSLPAPPVTTVPPPPLGPPRLWGGVLSSDALFDFNRHDLRPDSEATLRATYREIVRKVATRENLVIVVRGYADGVGEPEYNLSLSRKRAEAVGKRLVKLLGGDRDRPKPDPVYIPCGQTGTVNGLPAERGRNEPKRRAVVVTVYKDSVIDGYPNLKREAMAC